MIIIGEKINGFIPRTFQAIEEKDETYIRHIAEGQAEGGATYIDVCAGTKPEIEMETMEWLIGLVQDTVDTPICIDSSDPQIILDCMPLVNKPGCLNSISLEEGKCEAILPKIAGTDWKVVALTCDAMGIPEDPHTKYEIAVQIIKQATELGIPHDNILIDPLVTTLATNQNSMISFIDTIRLIKETHPDVHFTSGLSNISFGMPYRKAINMQFLAHTMAAGMDSAIMDPMSKDMLATMHATEALYALDPYCGAYLKAYKKGLFPVAPKRN